MNRGAHQNIRLALIVTIAATVVVFLPGCGTDGDKTVTVEKTVTVPAAEAGSSPETIEEYKSVISEITREADGLNNEFRQLVERFNRGEVTVDELIRRSELNWQTYEDLIKKLTEMSVPQEFTDAHAKLISGFGKWRSSFETYRDGFRENNSILLDRARQLDSEAVIEVNQAINAIQQVS